MIITYDSKVDALYLQFVEGKHEVTTLRLSEDVMTDCDPKGEIVGMEILSAREHLLSPPPEALRASSLPSPRSGPHHCFGGFF